MIEFPNTGLVHASIVHTFRAYYSDEVADWVNDNLGIVEGVRAEGTIGDSGICQHTFFLNETTPFLTIGVGCGAEGIPKEIAVEVEEETDKDAE